MIAGVQRKCTCQRRSTERHQQDGKQLQGSFAGKFTPHSTVCHSKKKKKKRKEIRHNATVFAGKCLMCVRQKLNLCPQAHNSVPSGAAEGSSSWTLLLFMTKILNCTNSSPADIICLSSPTHLSDLSNPRVQQQVTSTQERGLVTNRYKFSQVMAFHKPKKLQASDSQTSLEQHCPRQTLPVTARASLVLPKVLTAYPCWEGESIKLWLRRTRVLPCVINRPNE